MSVLGLRRLVAVATAVLLTATTAGCRHHAAAASAPRISITPSTSSLDQDVHIVVHGLPANSVALIALSSADAAGVRWRSSASFRSDSTGTVDLDRDPARSGSYAGVHGMGLIWSQVPGARGGDDKYQWNGAGARVFTVSVRQTGGRTTSAQFRRVLSVGAVSTQSTAAAVQGFAATFSPGVGSGLQHTAVMVLGGSEGGLPSGILERLLAAHGYPTLGLAYFGYRGLPRRMLRIPLEYFARATRWLRHHRGVRRVVVIGISRGSEAAQLLAAYYPRLVQGVVASVPNNLALCAYPHCEGPAWTVHGRPVPFTRDSDIVTPLDNPRAFIPVERIRGPMLMVCGDADQVWPSCAKADQIVARLEAHHARTRHSLLVFGDADHFVGGLYPNEPVVGEWATTFADQQARTLIWPRLLRFLASI
ncbi:MAG: hypothetical protein QOF18_2798 [Frankiaceae bacterium]|nr:hypothetical protein [Frankiaceae bacterium]